MTTALDDPPPPPASQPAAGTTTPAISAVGVTKRFEADPVVSDLHLDIEPGAIIGLIGPSGCGKTTTVRMLAGLLSPTEGTVEVNGRTATRLSAAERARIGYLPQSPALFDDLSLWENISFHASMYGLPFRRRTLLRSLLEWVELLDDRTKRVSEVSGGMQRRLALASTFVHDPDLVFLDEPTAGIDPILRDKFWQQFRALGAEGRTLVVTTQYVGEASHCDLVGLLSDGELLMLDTPANLRRAAFGGEVIDLSLTRPPTDEEVGRLAGLPFVVGNPERIAPEVLRVVVDDADDALMQVRNRIDELGLALADAAEYAVDYDEAFVRVVERHRGSTAAGPDNAAQAAAAPSEGDVVTDGNVATEEAIR